MTPRTGLISWRVTRMLFSAGAASASMGIARVAMTGSWGPTWALLLGLALIGLATRGPWDSAESGRDRRILGLRARPRRCSENS